MSKTNEEDPIEYYYKPLTGWLYRRRLEMAMRAIGPGSFHHLLEAGYGSGVFLPALSEVSQRLSAFDLHRNVELVHQMLAQERVQANLWIGDLLHIGIRADEFDAVVCLSVLEHLTDAQLRDAVSEIARISQPQAKIVLGFPCRNVITDAFYRLVGYAPRSIHPSSHEEILHAIESSDDLRVIEVFKFLPLLPSWLNAYMVCSCVRL